MRFRLTFRRQGNKRILPINYQYELSSWIYRVLGQADQQFATWLHDQGYQFEGKQFRLFGFSNLDLRPFDRQGDRIRMKGDCAKLELGFGLPESGQHFIQGLFAEQSFRLGDQQSQVDFAVETLDLLAPPLFTSQTRWRTLSPVCVSRNREDGSVHYLHPEEEDYPARLYHNLMRKMQSYTLAQGGLALPIPPYEPSLMRFELLSQPRSSLITLAAGTPRETRVRGYRYDFRLEADPSWLEFVWSVGLGEKNSMGFGFVGVG